MEMRRQDLAHPLQLRRPTPAQTLYGQVNADVRDWRRVFVIVRSVREPLSQAPEATPTPRIFVLRQDGTRHDAPVPRCCDGILVRSGRLLKLRLADDWPWTDALTTAFDRLQHRPARC